MIDSKDFERLASRYADGETSDGETASVRNFLIRDSRAQADMQRIETESEWIAKAFRRKPEDISNLVIKVRQRNPHARRQISPLMTLAFQLVLLLSMLYSLFELNSELAPPQVVLESTVGEVTVQRNEYLDSKDSVPLNRLLETGEGAGAKVRIGSADSFIAGPNSSLRVLSPRPSLRHFLSVEDGEVWARFTDTQAGCAVELAGIAADGEVAPRVFGRQFEVNVGIGDSVAAFMSPRGAPNRTHNAAVRLLEGVATLKVGDAEYALEAGTAVLFAPGSSAPMIVRDPDANHYRRLRVGADGYFKSKWDWLNPESFPLGRDILTYDAWKILVEAADKLALVREKAIARDGPAEIVAFKKAVSERLAASEEYVAKRKAKATGGETTDARRRELLATYSGNATLEEHLVTLHLEAPATSNIPYRELLSVFAGTAADMMAAWDRGEREMWSLTVATDATQLQAVLTGMAEALTTRIATADRRSRAIAAEQLALVEEIKELEQAIAELSARQSSEHRDPDQSRRDKLDKELVVAEERVRELQALRPRVQVLEELRKPYLDRIDDLGKQLKPKEDEHKALTAAHAREAVRLDGNTFKPEALRRVEASISATEKSINTNEQAEKRLEQEISEQSGVVTRTAETAANAKLAVEAGEKDKAAAEQARTESAEAEGVAARILAEASEALEKAESALAIAKAAFDALPEGQRVGSAEEAALTTATAERDQKLAEHDEASQSHIALREAADKARVAFFAAENKLKASQRDLATAETNASAAVGDLEAKRGELALNQRQLASDRESLKAFKAEEVELLRLKKEREDIIAEMARLTGLIDPLFAEITSLKAKVAKEHEGLKPHSDELDALNNRLTELPNAIDKQEAIKRQRSAMEAAEIREHAAELSLATAQTNVIEQWLLVVARMSEFSTVLGGGSRELPPALASSIADRNALLEILKPDSGAIPSELQTARTQAIESGKKIIVELNAVAERETLLNAESLDRLRGTDLATSWLKAIAAHVRNEALDSQHNRIESYRKHAQEAHGFGLPQPGAGSIAERLLLAAKAGGHESDPKLDSEVMLGLLRTQWELFVELTTQSEKERTADASARESNRRATPAVRRFYLPLLRENPTSPALRDISSAWSAHLVKSLGESTFKGLAAARR